MSRIRPKKFSEGAGTTMSEENKATVRRYFAEALDKRNMDILDEFFTADCVIHRPEASEALVGLDNFKRALGTLLDTYSEFRTTVHDLFASDDRVACRLRHRAVNRDEWTSRIGRHAVAGKTVSWSATIISRFRDGKIAEEWVCRDELGMLITLGVLSSTNATYSEQA
ncbi:MAG TPA: ester cyclase [Candidatus Binatia bacterium]|nr:ester cyclase [Candidatus Binatia bacterium]